MTCVTLLPCGLVRCVQPSHPSSSIAALFSKGSQLPANHLWSAAGGHDGPAWHQSFWGCALSPSAPALAALLHMWRRFSVLSAAATIGAMYASG